MNNKAKGSWGEQEAIKLLLRKGYKILEKNYVIGANEADIICKKGNILVFVEVKTRDDTKFGLPIEAITKPKMQGYFTIAKLYVLKNRLMNMDIRFDVVVVLREYISHVENAFDMTYL